MPTPVFTYACVKPLTHELVREFLIGSHGDGYRQTISEQEAFTRADGCGSTASYKGLNRFVIGFRKIRYGSGQAANAVWTFFRQRLDANNEAFYFYNPVEEPNESNWNGTSTTGRYLMALENPERISREYIDRCLFNQEGIALKEVRE